MVRKTILTLVRKTILTLFEMPPTSIIKSYSFRAWCLNYEHHLEQLYKIVNQYKGSIFKEVNITDFVYFVYISSSKKLNPYILEDF